MIRFLIFINLILVSNFSIGQNPYFDWVKSIDGISGYDSGKKILADGLGNIYVVGGFVGTADFDPGPNTFILNSNGNQDVFVVKLDISGNFLWAISFGGANDDYVSAIKLDSKNNIYISGQFYASVDFNPGNSIYNLTATGTTAGDIYLLKLDSTGAFIFAKNFGDIYTDSGNDLEIDEFGNTYLIGYFSGTVDFNSGVPTYTVNSTNINGDIFILKLDSSGSFIWVKSIGGIGHDHANSIALDFSGNIYISGFYNNVVDFDPGSNIFNLTASGNGDVFVLKIDSSGNFIWAKGIGGSNYDDSFSLKTDKFGDIIYSGIYGLTVDFDPGNGVFNMTAAGSNDIFISKLTSTGNFVWAKSIGGTNSDFIMSIEIDSTNNIFAGGYFRGTCDFDPSLNFYTLTSLGGYDIFFSKYDSIGNFIWARSFGGTVDDFIGSVFLDKNANFLITGAYNGTVDFDFNSGVYYLTSTNSSDIFVLKMSSNFITQFSENINTNNIQFYPNPNNGVFTVDIKSKSQIIITNVLGQDVYKKIVDFGKQNLQISDLENGIYNFTIISDVKKQTFKFIKQ